MVEGDPHFAVEVVAEERDLGIPLTEVIQHDELSVHLHPNADSLGRGAGKRFRFTNHQTPITDRITQPLWKRRNPNPKPEAEHEHLGMLCCSISLFSSTISHVQGLM